MTRKMQAAIVEQFGKPLTLQEWDIPTPGPGQILVKTEGLRRLPYRSPRRPWRLAVEAETALYSRP